MITQWSHLPFILNILFKYIGIFVFVCRIAALTLILRLEMKRDDNNNARHAKQVCKINHIITSDLFTWMTLMTENGLFYLVVCAEKNAWNLYFDFVHMHLWSLYLFIWVFLSRVLFHLFPSLCTQKNSKFMGILVCHWINFIHGMGFFNFIKELMNEIWILIPDQNLWVNLKLKIMWFNFYYLC